MKVLKEYKQKKTLQIEIIENTEKFFAQQKFNEKWQQCKITNFEYLMLLNKYGGRSFNDLSQYFVFPWVISDYSSSTLSYKKPETYRQFKYPIAAISLAKRTAADKKLTILLKEQDSEITPFQFGSHYLAARMVLGYLLRLEPFASLLIQFEDGPDATARMFHTLENQWEACNRDVSDNKELIPEFFYLPEMFANYNSYSFGSKRSEDGIKGVIPGSILRVDQVVLPEWAKNNHDFVKSHFLALESKHASLELHQWIDLVFGEKQQDTRYYNRFKDVCDEDMIYRQANRLTEAQIVEIQEFGCNPIRLFREKHVVRDKTEFDKKTKNTIFVNENSDTSFAAILSQLYAFPESVALIATYEKRLLFLLNDQKVYRTKDEPLKLAEEKAVLMEKRETALPPYKRILLEEGQRFQCDYQRTVALLDEGGFVITCRHYDNSCKISVVGTDAVLHHLHFHRAMVSSICTTKDKKFLFTGAQDGTVAMWDLNGFKLKIPKVIWYSCDNKQGIVTMDANLQLDLVASGSIDNAISVRVISTGKFFRLIKTDSKDYAVNQVRLSPRGYVLVISRPKQKTDQDDLLTVYSINGEKIASRQALGSVNAVLMDEVGYKFITGGNVGMLYMYDLLSLDSCKMLTLLDESIGNSGLLLKRLTTEPNAITALAIRSQEVPEQLLIGMKTGEVLRYQYHHKKKVNAGKMCDSIHGLLSGT